MTTQISLEEPVLRENTENAERNRQHFAKNGVYVLNLMSGAGAGKTTLVERLADALKSRLRLAIIAADLETRRDADRIERHGVPVVQINTGGACHVEAHQILRAAEAFDLPNLDLVVVENVGNLVCPAEFDLGETDKVMILSCTEGDDKPGKYPLMFKEARAMIVNKVDLLPHTNFDVDAAVQDARKLNPDLQVFRMSARTGEGLAAFCDWLEGRVRSAKR